VTHEEFIAPLAIPDGEVEAVVFDEQQAEIRFWSARRDGTPVSRWQNISYATSSGASV